MPRKIRISSVWRIVSFVLTVVLTVRFGFGGDAKSYAILVLGAIAVICGLEALILKQKVRQQDEADAWHALAQFGTLVEEQ